MRGGSERPEPRAFVVTIHALKLLRSTPHAVNYKSGHAIFEATHGTAPKYANQDKVNPGSMILSVEMMLRHMGWDEAADLVMKGLQAAIRARTVTYDFHRQMESAGDKATLLKCSEFGNAIVKGM